MILKLYFRNKNIPSWKEWSLLGEDKDFERGEEFAVQDDGGKPMRINAAGSYYKIKGVIITRDEALNLWGCPVSENI